MPRYETGGGGAHLSVKIIEQKDAQSNVFSTNFFLRFSRVRVDLLSYKKKTTDKREQYD